MALTTKYP